MPRVLPDWIEAYKEHAVPCSEAPEDFHEWVALSTLAAATRRRIWIDMRIFDWVTNLYIVFVGPPGIVTKSTTIGIGTKFLRKIPTIKVGQESSTWQKLLESLANAAETVPYKDEYGRDKKLISSPLTLAISELGTFLKTRDGDMIDALTRLWDGQRDVFEHGTKTTGDSKIENAWLNIIGGTTPRWIAENFTESMIGGGFASRVLFIPGEMKSKFVAWPDEMMPEEKFYELEKQLASDLLLISAMSGKMKLGYEVREWGRKWYKEHWFGAHDELQANGRFDGYRARKWTILQKLAMLYSVSRIDGNKEVQMCDMEKAMKLLGYAESHMAGVLESASETKEGKYIKELVKQVKFHGWIPPMELYKKLMNTMTLKDFEVAMRTATDTNLLSAKHKTIDKKQKVGLILGGKNEEESQQQKKIIEPGVLPSLPKGRGPVIVD